MNVWQSLRRLMGRAEAPPPVRRWTNPPVAIVQRGKSARVFLDERTISRRVGSRLDHDALREALLRQIRQINASDTAEAKPRAKNGSAKNGA